MQADDVRAAREGLTRLYRELDRVDEILKRIEKQQPQRRETMPFPNMSEKHRREWARTEIFRLQQLQHALEKADRENRDKMETAVKKWKSAPNEVEGEFYRQQVYEYGPLTTKFVEDIENVKEQIAEHKRTLGIKSQMKTNEFYK
jgi:hypothetical protein